jgi:hypothetical protein
MGKRIDECLFCSSRKCHARIVRSLEPKYDEIACDKHVRDLQLHNDEALGKNNGIMRVHQSGSRVKRGQPYAYQGEI